MCINNVTTHVWFSLINVAIFVVFLAYLKQDEERVSEHFDEATISPADYAVMITGLQRFVNADEMENGRVGLDARLYADLHRFGYPHSDISHIELGRVCKTEMKLVRRLEGLKVSESEIDARRKLQHLSEAEQKRLYHAHGQVWVDLGAVQSELETIRQQPQRSTGHAFIVFKYKKRRDHFLRKCAPPSATERIFFCAEAKVKFESANYKPIQISKPPEPLDIYWQNLEHTPEFRRRTKAVAWTITVLLIVASVAVSVVIKSESAARTNDRDPNEISITSAVSLLGAPLVISVTNEILKVIIPLLTLREGLDTLAAYESAVFMKLATAYILNNCILPIIVGYFPYGITQAWYEKGGVIAQAITLILLTGVLGQLYYLTQPITLLKRYVLARWAVSQDGLDKLWDPPRMPFAQLFASTLKLISLGLIYAPFSPLSYVWTAILLLSSWLTTKVGLSFWCVRLPNCLV